ncbi:hypothetical protein KHA80_19140 [Anaerobacillus sp. HL2]|nr:hypothetical protein KHA80_19140 [Anaerobacillus sp. HL2]
MNWHLFTSAKKRNGEAINVCKNTSQNRSSMLKDIEERKTEIEAITGVVFWKGKRKKCSSTLSSFSL